MKRAQTSQVAEEQSEPLSANMGQGKRSFAQLVDAKFYAPESRAVDMVCGVLRWI